MLGVLGGMGPLATVDFLDKLVRQTRASCDQDHIPVIVASIPQIPDRSDALLRGSASPLPAMLASVDRLTNAGADLIVIPCNTAHVWYEEIAARAGVPVLHIVRAVLDELRECGLSGGVVGLLATTATVQAGIYQATLREAGLECRVPVDDTQVMTGIRAVKAGELALARDLFAGLVRELLANGCDLVVLGCTEIPVALDGIVDLAAHTVDAGAALARAAIHRSGASTQQMTRQQ